MDNEVILHILTRIRDKYRGILRMTAPYKERVEIDECIDIMEKRAHVLQEIEEERSTLLREANDWRSRCAKDDRVRCMLHDIRSAIEAIVDLDSVVQQEVARQMSGIRAQLRDITDSSRAAVSYAAHSTSCSVAG